MDLIEWGLLSSRLVVCSIFRFRKVTTAWIFYDVRLSSSRDLLYSVLCLCTHKDDPNWIKLCKIVSFVNWIILNENLLQSTGSAIKCFECNSHKEPNCALDIPPDNLLKDCSTEYPSRPNGASTYCRKIKQNIDIEVNNCEYWKKILKKKKSYRKHKERTGVLGNNVSGAGAKRLVFRTLCGVCLLHTNTTTPPQSLQDIELIEWEHFLSVV